MKTRDKNHKPTTADRARASCHRAEEATAVRRGIAHGTGDRRRPCVLARDLGNLPANICTPSYLVQQARAVARRHRRLRLQVLSEAQMRRLGMGSLLSVTAGSEQPARFIILRYQGGARGKAPVVLVGKGITFDTGGISLKPGPQMDEMKYDMSGAGTVIAVMQAVAELDLPIDVIGLVPTCENMPGGIGHPARATSSGPCPGRPSRSSTPTPRDG